MLRRLSKKLGSFLQTCPEVWGIFKEYEKIKVRHFKSTFWFVILCSLERA
jgi:hypothetical protein